ncbi:MAG: bacteriohemerythrin [Lachnospiraceae bacterium]|nr:bacteriohemerythrin [Lachnospiraceae bacterium]
MFEMKDEYLTGIKQIDEEHARLFEIAEEAYQLLKEEYVVDKYDNIVTIINELKDYTRFHFAHEEEYMESIGYKKMFTQKIQHMNFIERLEELNLEEVDVHQEESIEELLTFLGNWLVEHILECDKQIGK